MLTKDEFNAKIPQLLRETAETFAPDEYPLYIVAKADGTIVAETFKSALAIEVLLRNYETREWIEADAEFYSEPDAQSDDTLHYNYLRIIEKLNPSKNDSNGTPIGLALA